MYFAQRSVFVQKALKNHEMTYFPRRILKNVKEMVQSELLGSRSIRQPLFLNIIFPLLAMRNGSFSTFEQAPKNSTLQNLTSKKHLKTLKQFIDRNHPFVFTGS